MTNPLKELLDLLDKSDDFVMAIESKLDPEGKKILKEADRHLDEAYKALKKLQTRVVLSNVIKKYSNEIKNRQK